MNSKWNLGDIVPANRAERTPERPLRTQKTLRNETTISPREVSEPAVRKPPRSKRRIVAAVVLIFVAAAAIFAASKFLGGAEVEVHPKQRTVSVEANLAASLTPGEGVLGFEYLTLTEEGERTVTASGEEEASVRATGKIKVRNEYSEESQRLIKNTRFEGTDGLIFRITDSIVVPGFTRAADGSIIPGEISAEAFADAPGDSYNIAPTRFSIPGLKDTDQYEKVYGVSDEPMAGGFIGPKYIIDQGELERAQGEIRSELETKLRERLQTERPNGFILYDSSIFFEYEPLASTDAGNKNVLIRERVNLHAPIFNEEAFAATVARNTMAEYENERVRILDPISLIFSYSTTSDERKPDPDIAFSITGSAQILSIYDSEKFRQDLAGRETTALPAVLGGHPAIEKAEATVRPFWESTFPESVEDIKIIETLDE